MWAPCGGYLLKDDFQFFWGYRSLARVLPRPMVHAHDAIEDRADEARRPHVAGPSTAILNWFRAKGQLSSGVVEG